MWWLLKKPLFGVEAGYLSALSTDAPGELDVLGHDGHPLGVDGAKVGILKETNKVSLTGLLKCGNSRALEAQVGLEVLGDFSDQSLEGQLPDKQLGRLLVSPDLPEGDGSRPVTMRLLHPSGGRGTLPCSLGGQLLPWSLSSS